MGEAKTTSEAADVLKLSAKRVRELAFRGQLPGRQAGRFWLFDADDLAAFAKVARPPGWKKGKPRTKKKPAKRKK